MYLQRRGLIRLIILLIAATGLTFYLHAKATAQSPATPPREDRGGKASGQQEQLPLEEGKPVERELRGGEVHNYRLVLNAEQYLHVIVEQRGVDVVASLFGPDDKKLVEVDSPNGTEGPEPILTIIEQPGSYRLEVRSLENSAPAGRYEARIETRRAATAQDRTDVAVLELLKQAEGLKAEGRYDQAAGLLQKAVELQEKTFGKEHPQVAATLNVLAELHHLKADYARAESLLQRALLIREKALGPEHPDVAQSLNNLAKLFYVKGDYERAEQLFRRSLSIREQAFGAQHPEVAQSLNNLANVYLARSEYLQAEPLFERALLIREKALAPGHPDVASTLESLALLYQAKGDDRRAEDLLRRALSIYENAYGPEHPYIAYTVTHLEGIYRARRDYQRAEPLLRRALAIREKHLGPQHPEVGSTLNNLALLYQEQGDYERAEPLFQRALVIYEKQLGVEHPSFAQTLNNLAVISLLRRDYQRSEVLFQRALTLREKTFGPRNPVVAATLVRFAVMYETKGDVAKAVQLQTRSNEIRERDLSLIIVTGSEEQKRLYLTTLTDETDLAISLHNRSAPRNVKAAKLALTTVLRRKGRALDATAAGVGALRRRLGPQDRALFDQLNSVNSQLASVIFREAGAPAESQAEAVKLDAERQRLEAKISARSVEFRAQTQDITLEGVRQSLPASAALVELVSYRPFNLQARTRSETFGAPRYAAYVLRRDGPLQWIELGEAADIDRDVAELRTQLATPSSREVKRTARALDEKVMRPVRRLLGNTRNLFISPDGALHLIPFAALVDERGRYLVENYSITYLTSGRDLLRLQARSQSKGRAVVIANPSFSQAVVAPANEPVTLGATATLRATDLTQMKFSSLPGTAGEAADISKILPESRILTGPAATESALKQVEGPRILHVATHGFFLSDERGTATDTRGISLGAAAPVPPQPARNANPLLRSGLALAGANQLQSGAGQDGILTALEASGLDLWGTKLVVLSACETGVGEVTNGEGVYGLRRALVLAGAESQVISLWRVSDKVTRDLMVEYYRRLMAGAGRTEALRRVQLKMLRGRAQREGGQGRGLLSEIEAKPRDVSHPFFWAAFIHSGDWERLSNPKPRAK